MTDDDGPAETGDGGGGDGDGDGGAPSNVPPWERTTGRTTESGDVRTDRTETDGGVAESSTAVDGDGDATAGSTGCPVAEPPHPAADLLSLLGKAHAMRVLATLARAEPRAWRFGELEDELGVSPNTLSARLSEFEEAGLVTRTAYDEIPPRVEYEATDRARELDPVFRELHAWMDRHGGADGEGGEDGADATADGADTTADETDVTLDGTDATADGDD